MTGSDPSAVQALAASRVYRIQAAVRSLNADIRAAQEESSTWAPNFQFIARSWRPGADTWFNFTYFEVFEFDETKAQEIVGDIKDNTDAWSRLLDTLAGSLSEPSVQEARTFVEQILESQPCPEDVNRADLHHHLLQLMATMDVGGAIPAAVQCRLDTRTSDRHVAYRVELRVNNERELPDLRIVPIDQDEKPSHGQSDDEWAEQLLSFGGEETGNSADGTDDNPSAAFMKQSRYWFRHSNTSRRADSCFLWIPVYEDSRFGHFAGRFLGWLFCPNPDGQLTWEDVSRCLRACNAFARDLVHIYTQAFLTLPADEGAYRNDPRKSLEKHLPAWEGWEKVDLLDTWRGEKNHWWRYCKKTRQLQLRLGATDYDDPGAWGDYPALGPVAIKPGVNVRPGKLDDWTPDDCQRQADHIRTLTRRLCSRVTALEGAKNAAKAEQTRKSAGGWSHEIKNYTDNLIIAPLGKHVPGTPAYNPANNAQRQPDIERAYRAAKLLNVTAVQIHGLYENELEYNLDADTVKTALFYLLDMHKGYLASKKQVLSYHIENTSNPKISAMLDVCDTKYGVSIAVLREIIHNIRNEKPPTRCISRCHNESCTCQDIVVTWTICGGQDQVSATIKQEQWQEETHSEHCAHEACQPKSLDEATPGGIVAARSLFGPCGFDLGDIKVAKPVCLKRCSDHCRIERTSTVTLKTQFPDCDNTGDRL